MNKQTLIEKLIEEAEKIHVACVTSNPASVKTNRAFYLAETALENAIGFAEKLDEPQKVKVPAFVAEWFEENKHNLNFAIYELCEAGKVPVDLYEGLTDFERWFYLNHDIDTLIRMQDGCEVEEEPKWVVKIEDNGSAYFVDFFDELQPHLVYGLSGEVMRFDSEDKANAIVTLIECGTVEKV